MELIKRLQNKSAKVAKISAVAAALLWFIVLTYASNVDINNPLTGCPKGQMNMSAKATCCTNMNRIRRPFKECCLYPLLVIWRWQFDLCVAKCNDDLSSYTSSSYRCCVLPCCFTYLKVIDAHPELNGIQREGVKYSFMLSVGNRSEWTHVIGDSVDMSFNQLTQPIPNMTDVTDPVLIKAYDDFWDCFELIPNYLYDIIDSAYNQNYLRCPLFNSTLDRCDLTRQYVQDCFVDYIE